MNTIITLPIELPNTCSSIVASAVRTDVITVAPTTPFATTGLSSGRVVGLPGHVSATVPADVPANGMRFGDATRARNAKQASPPRGPSR